MGWQSTLIERLLASADADGGWSYRPGTSPCAEPTAMVCLALAAQGVEPQRQAHGLAWLAKQQRSDGGVPVSAAVSSPRWTTALAVLAWLKHGVGPTFQSVNRQAGNPVPQHVVKAVRWLIKARGRPIPLDQNLFGHNTTLVGWPWVSGTHSWAEPTAYAILALRAAGEGNHPRAREGIRVLVDRVLPGGGWNYGNTRVLKSTLRPFPATTGIVLTALAREPTDKRIDASIAYLTEELQRIRSPLTLGWGLIGLTAWSARPDEAQNWLNRCAARNRQGQPNSLHDALLLLADARWYP